MTFNFTQQHYENSTAFWRANVTGVPYTEWLQDEFDLELRWDYRSSIQVTANDQAKLTMFLLRF